MNSIVAARSIQPSAAARPGTALSRVAWLDLKCNPETPRRLTFLEFGDDAPFEVRRIYWIHGTEPGELRGHHAHRTTQQLMLALSGSFRIVLDDATSKSTYVVDDPARGLWLPAGLWREFEILQEGTVVLVLASTRFDEADYIRDYAAFQRFALEERR
jgi:dTDP-4-dehydrorhamnose 3,5-epimerase-like enzyme